MFGDVSAWFYKYLAGIQIDSPGFKTFVLQPHVVGDLTSARGAHDTVYGTIVSDWKIADGQFQWHVTVPANTTATVMVPCDANAPISESGALLAKATGIKMLGYENGYAKLAVEAGDYNFTCAAPKK